MQENLLKIFCLEGVPGKNWIPILDFKFGPRTVNTLFQNIKPKLYEGIFDFVDSPENADYFLMPNSYSVVKKNKEYTESCVKFAQKFSKMIILFAYQDSAEPINIPQTIVFRTSQYRSALASNEIIMPAFVEDVGLSAGLSPKNKNIKLSVGFVGKAGFENLAHRVRFLIKNIFLLHGAHKDGLYFRRKAMKALARDSRIKSNFKTRSSFSGNLKTVGLDPEKVREEYISNMKESDFTLSPRGDGNYSLRFYETLSMGRIPILIDTDVVLPLEDKINYDDIVIRVDYKDIHSIADIVAQTYEKWSSEEYLRRQKLAREVFEKYLYMPAFIKATFNKEVLSRYHPTLSLESL
jgi:hypothetical protein